MKLRSHGHLIRLIKILWLPIILLFLIALEPYIGVFKTRYALLYIGLQVVLFIVYAYILFKDKQNYTKGMGKSRKGSRKN